MRTIARRTAIAVAMAFLSAGAAFAAEKCCCKDGEKMACCDEMHKKDAAPKPAETSAPQPEHKH